MYTQILSRAVSLAILSLVAGAAAQSQPAADRAPVSLAVALGPSFGGGAHVGVSAIVQRGRALGTARVSGTEFGPRISQGLFRSARDYTEELSVLVGVAQPVAGRWQVAGLVGVSANRTTRHEAGPCFPTVLGCIPGDGRTERSGIHAGLPMEVGMYGPVAGAFGLGLRAFANLNSDETYGGVSVEFRLNPRRGSGRSR